MRTPYKGKFKVTQQFKGSAHDGLDLVGIESKNIYSTVDGVVEYAGWESALNHKKGFGKYVRIKQNNSVDRYYFGHLSEIKVKKGQKVTVGMLIGIEGNTGHSFGSHCHYCVRGNSSKSQIRDVCAISGIKNALGTYEEEIKTALKSLSEIVKEVINGKWGTGKARETALEKAGYDYKKVQAEVNRVLAADTLEYYKRYVGSSASLVTALNSLGYKSSFSYRKTIAKANGISGYIGTAKQNTKMLTLLKQGKLIKP